MFVQVISSESPSLLLPNFAWWCIIMSQIVSQKDWSAVFKITVTVKDCIIKIRLSNLSTELLILLQLNLVWWHIIISWIVLRKAWITLLWSRSQRRFNIQVNVHQDEIYSPAKLSLNSFTATNFRGFQVFPTRLGFRLWWPFKTSYVNIRQFWPFYILWNLINFTHLLGKFQIVLAKLKNILQKIFKRKNHVRKAEPKLTRSWVAGYFGFRSRTLKTSYDLLGFWLPVKHKESHARFFHQYF